MINQSNYPPESLNEANSKIHKNVDFPISINAHIEALESQFFEAVPHQQLLERLLAQVKPVDFWSLATEIEGRTIEELKQKHYVVLVVREVIRFAKVYGWALCVRFDAVYLYNGAFWREIDRKALERFLGEAAAKMGTPTLEAEHFEFRKKLREQFLVTAYLPEPTTDEKTVLVNVKNGTLEISANGYELRPPAPKDFLTYQLPFLYDPQAKAPMFDKYLNRCLPDQDLQRVLSEFFGWTFTKHLKLEKALFLHGEGANGKSVMFEIINALMGKDNVTTMSISDLREEHNRALLVDKLLCYGSEIGANGMENDGFKTIVSNEQSRIRRKYGNPFTVKIHCKLAFNANELPPTREINEAFFRRFLIVPFNQTIPTTERDPLLASKIIDNELSGVFNWVLAGLDRLLNNGRFTAADASRDALDIYRKESDSVAMFVEEEGFEHDPLARTFLKEIYPQYRTFCQQNGFVPLSSKKVRKRFEGLGFSVGEHRRLPFFAISKGLPV